MESSKSQFEKILWGALAFGAGGALAGSSLVGVIWGWFSSEISFWALLMGGFSIGGAIGGAFSSRPPGYPVSTVRNATSFGAAFLLPGPVLLFSTISLQAGVEVLWASISWGLSLAVAGGLGGVLSAGRIWTRRAWQSALAFMVGGAAGGPLSFLLFGATGHPLALLAGVPVAFALGGGLLGWFESLNEPRE